MSRKTLLKDALEYGRESGDIALKPSRRQREFTQIREDAGKMESEDDFEKMKERKYKEHKEKVALAKQAVSLGYKPQNGITMEELNGGRKREAKKTRKNKSKMQRQSKNKRSKRNTKK